MPDKDYQSRHEDIAATFEKLRRAELPGNVREVHGAWLNAQWYSIRLDGVMLLACLEVECVRGELWAHLSVSAKKPARIPTWKELSWCKEFFLGDRKAIQVLPPKDEYVNVAANALNLYAPLERDPLPDFRGIDASGRLAL